MLGRLMQVEGTHALVVSWCMVLAEVVAQVGVSWFPVNSELSLFNTVLEPVESHVNGFGLKTSQLSNFQTSKLPNFQTSELANL